MVRTLVLGAGGFLGARIVETALARDARGRGEVVAVARDFARAPARFLGNARRLALDLEAGAERLLEAERPARVVSAAALARVGACERDPELARRINTELPGRLAEWCAAHGARLVHVSTDLVFGATPPPAGGFREEDPPAPIIGVVDHCPPERGHRQSKRFVTPLEHVPFPAAAFFHRDAESRAARAVDVNNGASDGLDAGHRFGAGVVAGVVCGVDVRFKVRRAGRDDRERKQVMRQDRQQQAEPEQQTTSSTTIATSGTT